jgi:hypothetical protein
MLSGLQFQQEVIMHREPIYQAKSGSTEGPGVIEEIFLNHRVSSYTIFTVPPGKLFVMEYVSAVVVGGANPTDYGTAGFKSNGAEQYHFIYFAQKGPSGTSVSSQSLQLNIPAGADVIVRVPLITGQSGGATVAVSGYYIDA